MNDKISVIVPVYNVELYLEECVNSIIEQTYKNWELLLLDDGSTDRSGELCDKLGDRDERIKVFHHPNMKQAKTRNRGIEECTGNYIMFLDSDDWLDRETLEKCMEVVKAKNADIVSFNIVREFQNKTITANCIVPPHEVVKIDNSLQQKRFGIGLPEDTCPTAGVACGKLISSEIIERNGIRFYDVQPCEDVLFPFLLFQFSAEHYFVNENLYHYRAREEISKRGKKKDYLASLDQYYTYMQNYLTQYNKGKDYWDRFYLSCKKLFVVWGIRNIYNIAGENYKAAGQLLKSYMKKEPYSKAIKLSNANELGKKEKLIWWLLSHGLYRAVIIATPFILKPRKKGECIPFL